MKIDKIEFTTDNTEAWILTEGTVRHVNNYPWAGTKNAIMKGTCKRTDHKDPSGGKFVDMSATSTHTLMLNDKGELFGVGENKYGRMVGSKIETYETPRKLPTPNNERVVKMFAKKGNTFILTTTGVLYGVGVNGDGQLAIPKGAERAKWIVTNPTVPDKGMVKFTDFNMASDEKNTKIYARTTEGDFYSWGGSGKKPPFKVSFPVNSDSIEKVIPDTHNAIAITRERVFICGDVNYNRHTINHSIGIADVDSFVSNREGTGAIFFNTKKNTIKVWGGNYSDPKENLPTLDLKSFFDPGECPPDINALPGKTMGVKNQSVRGPKDRVSIVSDVYIQSQDCVYALALHSGRSKLWALGRGEISKIAAIMDGFFDYPIEYISSMMTKGCK